MKVFLIVIAAIVVVVGLGVYEFTFKKISVQQSMSRDDAMKTCREMVAKSATTAAVPDPRMETVCECMMDANAAALNKKDGVTMIEWMTEVQKNTAACMAKAGIPTQ